MTTRATDQATVAVAGNHGMSLISSATLLQLYAALVKCGMLRERLHTLAEQRRFIISDGAEPGHEASTVGVTIDLLPEDSIFMAHGGFIAGFIKGDTLDSILERFMNCSNDTGQIAQNVSRLESQLDRATEAALANKAKMNRNISVAFLDANAVSSNLCPEAFRVAGAQKLPILFVCQYNPAAKDTSHIDHRGTKELVHQAVGYGIPCITVDDCDVVAVYRVATESIVHARKGNGPTLIECWPGLGSAHDPIRIMKNYLSLKGLLNEELKFEAAAFARQLDTAFETAARLKNS
jgi:TPP-dependent pyruvate/acetoin dehydrogenase alpha subunit